MAFSTYLTNQIKTETNFSGDEFQASKGINCNGRIHTDSDHQMLKELGNHTCIENGPARVQAQMAVSNIKRHALETLEQPETI